MITHNNLICPYLLFVCLLASLYCRHCGKNYELSKYRDQNISEESNEVRDGCNIERQHLRD